MSILQYLSIIMNHTIPFSPILLLCFLSCQSASSKQQVAEDISENSELNQDDYLLIPGHRIGRINVNNSTRKDVLNEYGKEAKLENIELGEGFSAEGVVMYPEDPERRVEMFWDLELDSLRPSFIRIVGDGLGHSKWHTGEGITIGTPIKEVERLNGKPFIIYGFHWDYGGIVHSWEGGNLQETLGLTFSPVKSDVPEYLQGEGLFQSNDKYVLEVEPVVSVIESSFRE